jgi:hypothetical protein
MIKYFPMTSIATLLMITALQACSIATPHVDNENNNEEVVCTEPRPEVCTMDYQPVCASLENGSRKTYSNGCNACSDLAIISYHDGTCD